MKTGTYCVVMKGKHDGHYGQVYLIDILIIIAVNLVLIRLKGWMKIMYEHLSNWL